MFYVKSLDKYTNVHLDLVVVKRDSPEFHDAKHLSCGNSSHTSIRGCLLNVSEVWTHIPSCEKCCKIMSNTNIVETYFLSGVCKLGYI
eukprot:7887127-Ditylum_brightwellii.AAC.1